MLRTRCNVSSLLLLAAVCACADDLQTLDDGDASERFAVRSSSLGDGLRQTTVNASVEDSYQHFDLDSDVESAPDSEAWDLAFCRFKIKTNGGDNGEGDVVVARLGGADFEALDQAPDQGYFADSEEIAHDSEGGDPRYAFLGSEPWYVYDGATHQLSAADAVYVVRSTEGDFYKIQLLDYYDDSGTAGYPQFRWAKIEPPEEITIGTLESGRDQADPSAEVEQGGDAQPTFGCYDPSDHTCGCESDKSACEARSGIWTERCSCDA